MSVNRHRVLALTCASTRFRSFDLAARSFGVPQDDREILMPDDELMPVFMPSLVSILLRAEREHGSPLNREHVLAIRDNCAVVMLPKTQAALMAESRGY